MLLARVPVVIWTHTSRASPTARVVRGRTLDVSQAYGRADIVLCPSREESFGRIAAEAMMNSIPVVASDIPAYRELVARFPHFAERLRPI